MSVSFQISRAGPPPGDMEEIALAIFLEHRQPGPLFPRLISPDRNSFCGLVWEPHPYHDIVSLRKRGLHSRSSALLMNFPNIPHSHIELYLCCPRGCLVEHGLLEIQAWEVRYLPIPNALEKWLGLSSKASSRQESTDHCCRLRCLEGQTL